MGVDGAPNGRITVDIQKLAVVHRLRKLHGLRLLQRHWTIHRVRRL